MRSTKRNRCPRCGGNKLALLPHCGKCLAIIQIRRLARNHCREQDCSKAVGDEHFLCLTHWKECRDGKINECPGCGDYKPTSFGRCRRCNAAQAAREKTTQQREARQDVAKPGRNNVRRYDDSENDPEDPKAKDKRYWFNRQGNGVCNYCGNRYGYHQLQMEHMIPRELGGPDNRRNMQLACQSCNRKKGTMTDLEFRELNRGMMPLEERTPPAKPTNPERIRSGVQGTRYR